MMDQIAPLVEIDYGQLFLTIVVVISGLLALRKLFTEFCDWLGLETKYMRERREQRELTENTARELKEMKDEYNAAFEKIYNKMDELLSRSEERDKEISDKITRVIDDGEKDEQRRNHISSMQIRHTLVSSCEHAIKEGEITFKKLKSIEDLYDVYHNPDYLNQNSYVTGLVDRVRGLRIVDEED